MIPRFSANYIRDYTLSSTEQLSYFPLAVLWIEASDRLYHFLCKARSTLKLPCRMMLPVFRHLVIHVVLVGSKEKVIRVNAFSVIAFVKHEKTARYFTVYNYP